MASIPSPYFPEPITVPGNVAAESYRTVVSFTRKVALLHLASLAAIVILARVMTTDAATDFLTNLGAEGVWLLVVAAHAVLAVFRHAHITLQLVVFAVFAVSLAGMVAGLAPFMADEFPDFAKTFAFTFGAAWVGLVLYNLLASRDYSMMGEFVLVALFVAVSLAVFTLLTDVWLSQAFAVYTVVLGLLFYWHYDLAMILRRRTPREPVAAALDIYRDLLNFVGFPVRVMRMPKGRRRFQT